MIKYVSNAFVFKFTGGDGKSERKCWYCGRVTKRPHVTVYANCSCNGESEETDRTLFVCVDCIKEGLRDCRESWKGIYKLIKSKEKVMPDLSISIVSAENGFIATFQLPVKEGSNRLDAKSYVFKTVEEVTKAATDFLKTGNLPK